MKNVNRPQHGVPQVPFLGPGNKQNLTFRIAALGLLFPLPTLLPAQQSKPWEQIPIPPLHAFHPQQPKRIELKNGIVVFLQEDHELPFIYGSVLIPGGSRDEDPAKAGLVDSLRRDLAHQRHRKNERRRHGRFARIQGRAY